MKQVRKAIINNEADIVYVAKDAKVKVVSDIEKICKEKLIDIVYVDTMKELGSSCGIDVSAATAAILK